MKKNLSKSIIVSMTAMLLAPLSSFAAGWVMPANSWNLPGSSAYTIIGNILSWILGILAIASITAIAISGIIYVTSGGDKERTDSAKKWLTYAIMGLAIALLSYAIVYTVDKLLRGSVT